MNKEASAAIIQVLLEHGGKVYRFGREGYGIRSSMSVYYREESLSPVITHVTTGSLKPVKHDYWLKSYGLTSWAIESKLSPRFCESILKYR